ncbi:glycosyltransferase 87 family protein, partial [Nocardia gipuzkoensis]
GVGLAAGIKLVPLFFVAYLLVLRQWRAAVTATSIFAVTVAGSWLVLPEDSREYWNRTFFQSNRIALDTHPANQSLRGAIAHLTQHTAPMRLWVPLSCVVGVAGLVVAAGLYRYGERVLSITLAGLTSCAVSPFSWSHHWVWFVPLLVWLVHRAQTRPRWWLAAAALYLSIGAWTYEWSPEWVVVGFCLFPPSWPIA